MHLISYSRLKNNSRLNKHIMKRIVAVLFAMVSLLSCSNNKSEPLRVGILLWPPYEFFYLAENLGYYQNKNIQLIDYRTPSEAIRAYKTGLLDAIIVTNHLFFEMNDQRLVDRIIMVINYSSGSDVLLGKPEIKSVNELKGKKVGAEASALGLYVMLRFLEINGLSPKDIKHIPVDVGNQGQSYKKGLLDGVVTYEPYATELKKHGAAELCNSKAIPLEISDILISTPLIIEQKREQLEILCAGFFKAQNVYQKSPSDYTSFLASRENVTDKEFLDALNGIQILDLSDNKKILLKSEESYFKTLSVVNRKMINYHLIKTIQNEYELIDNRIIENIDEN